LTTLIHQTRLIIQRTAMLKEKNSNAKTDETGTPCYVYVLGSEEAKGPRTYVGWTTDLERRLIAHNSGRGARSTRGRQWRLLYAERCESKSAALSREWRLKRDRGFRKLLSMLSTGAAGTTSS
jgi:putative endonuclease